MHIGRPEEQSKIYTQDLPEEGIWLSEIDNYRTVAYRCGNGYEIDEDEDLEQYEEGETAFQCASCETWWKDQREAQSCCYWVDEAAS